MSIIREKIKYVGANMNLKFSLGSDDGFLGYQQEIDNLTQVVTYDLVNPPVDVEVRRFKYYSPNTGANINFGFTSNGTVYSNLLSTIGFNPNDANYVNYTSNSFFIYELFDTYDVYTQTKIATTYVTKIGTIFSYDINSSNQVNYLSIPISYINAKLDLGITTITGYTRVSFYNAKSGVLILFNNTANLGYSTAIRMYFVTVLNLITNTWQFINISGAISPKQIYGGTYSNKVNNTFINLNNEEQVYPKGSTFNIVTGLYD